MKLIFLVFLATAFIGTHAFVPIIFDTEFTCMNAPKIWCVSAFFFDIDDSSKDDPLLYFRFCSGNRTERVTLKVEDPGGDGGLWGIFQYEYEIGYKIMHSCNAELDCIYHTNPQRIDYWLNSPPEYVRNTFIWPHHAHDYNSDVCKFPKAFKNLDGYYDHPAPPTDPFYLDDSDRQYSLFSHTWTQRYYGRNY